MVGGRQWGVLVLVGLLAGCRHLPAPQERLASALVLARSGGLSAFVPASPLPLAGFARLGCAGQALHVYIEGDGLAWLGPGLPSPDPTPLDPVALRLAAADAACNVVYLGRPGQYGAGTVPPRYWQGARFAPEVVAGYVSALTALAGNAPGARLRLVGFSGGGAVAALAAARLHAAGHAVELVTVAGNLDPVAWARGRRLTPLAGSLNPADETAVLQEVPQLHLTGRDDRQVPPWVLDAYVARLPTQRCLRVVTVAAGHAGPWTAALAQALAEPPACLPSRQGLR